jgi:hypothetical protein
MVVGLAFYLINGEAAQKVENHPSFGVMPENHPHFENHPPLVDVRGHAG